MLKPENTSALALEVVLVTNIFVGDEKRLERTEGVGIIPLTDLSDVSVQR